MKIHEHSIIFAKNEFPSLRFLMEVKQIAVAIDA
jgi:hypothetical protein